MLLSTGRFFNGAGGGGPGAGTDPHFANVVLLVGFDGTDGATTATDESNSAHSLTFVDNAQIDTGVAPPFGTASLLLDGSGDLVTVADSEDWNFAAGDFTVELRARPRINNLNRALISQYASSGSQLAWELYLQNDDISFKVSSIGIGGSSASTTGAAFTAATWHAVCFERSGTNFRIYIDGVMRLSSTAFGSNSIFNSNLVLAIGGRSDSDRFDGHIKEVRITKGVARYASDAGYTPPTEAFPRS